jgi:hypothetical protein
MNDGPSTLLIAALVLVFLAWRAARRRNQLLAAAQAAEAERRNFSLDFRESDSGRGFAILDADGQAVDPRTLDWDADGMKLLRLSGYRPGGEAGDHPDFTAGAAIELIPADDDPAVIEVWNAAMTARAGTLRPADATALPEHPGECLVLWETRSGGTRTDLLLLLVAEGMELEDG